MDREGREGKLDADLSRTSSARDTHLSTKTRALVGVVVVD